MLGLSFPFSFTLSSPGFSNPFLASHNTNQAGQAPLSDKHASLPSKESVQVRRRHPSPSLSPTVPVSRKRGWVPSSEPSLPAPTRTSTTGYLDTPSKYRDMAAAAHSQDDFEDLVAELPPPKRRRTLAGSIVSTALSAALIGTAVGFTVYRLWRDCGKQTESQPPPPYEQGQWVSPASTSEEPSVPITKVTPATPRHRKTRHVAGRRTIAALPRHRTTPSRSKVVVPPRSVSPAAHRPVAPQFDFAGPVQEPDEEDSLEEHVSFMGDRLAQLIAEGQRALGKEIVVMSEAKEDEEDDGMDVWVEDDEGNESRSGSISRRKSRRTNLLPSSSSFLGSSSVLSPPSTPRRNRTRGMSIESDTRSVVSASFKEAESEWQSPELRESMERARSLLYRGTHA